MYISCDFVLYSGPSERFYTQRGRPHQPLRERAWQRIRLVRRWLPARELVFVADSRFAAAYSTRVVF